MSARIYATSGSASRRRGSEGLVYIGGVVAGDEMVITSLYRLGHEAQGDCVIVTAEEARWLVRTLRGRDEKLVGQIHSHRFAAGHSPGDDQYATSFHAGYLSIVVPNFGRGVTSLDQCAVLEYRNGVFDDLGADEVAARIQIHPQVVSRVRASTVPSTDVSESSMVAIRPESEVDRTLAAVAAPARSCRLRAARWRLRLRALRRPRRLASACSSCSSTSSRA